MSNVEIVWYISTWNYLADEPEDCYRFVLTPREPHFVEAANGAWWF